MTLTITERVLCAKPSSTFFLALISLTQLLPTSLPTADSTARKSTWQAFRTPRLMNLSIMFSSPAFWVSVDPQPQLLKMKSPDRSFQNTLLQ